MSDTRYARRPPKTKLDSINFISVDSETMEEQFKEIKEKYNVDIKKPDGFPSLGKIVSGSYIEYPNDKPRDIGSLIQLITTCFFLFN
jgi:hypothetical protein